MDIKKFKYYNLLEKTINIEKSARSTKNKLLEKNDRISGSDKQLIFQSLKKVKQIMHRLTQGNAEDKLLLKQMELEREYIRALEKRELEILIETKTGQPAGGMYNLAEIGEVIGVTRERARQIEASAMKVLRHPNVGRAIKHYVDS